MPEFILDTTGRIPNAGAHYAVGGVVMPALLEWGDLDPFTQGYIEALFASLVETTHTTGWAFRYLAPETLAAILTDCERFLRDMGGPASAAHGRAFWGQRQRGDYASISDFPPLTVYLGDDGKVYLF